MKKKILLDMDEVIVKDYFLKAINSFTNKNYTYVDFKEYYMQDVIEDKEAFFKHFFKEGFYKYARIEEDVYSALEKLNEKYDIYILSSYIVREAVFSSGVVLLHKHEFLMKNFPFLDPNKFIFTSSKDVVKGDVVIDDRIENLHGDGLKLLFTAYHNLKYSDEYLKERGIIRVKSFKEIEEILL